MIGPSACDVMRFNLSANNTESYGIDQVQRTSKNIDDGKKGVCFEMLRRGSLLNNVQVSSNVPLQQ